MTVANLYLLALLLISLHILLDIPMKMKNVIFVEQLELAL